MANARSERLKAAVKKAKQAEKAMRAAFAKKTAGFKKKLKEVEKNSYNKALNELQRLLLKKEEAKAKILKAAEDKFEKSYASKFGKKMKPKKAGAKKKTSPSSSTGKRRGRPPKNSSAAAE